jgi:hypothetical protein
MLPARYTLRLGSFSCDYLSGVSCSWLPACFWSQKDSSDRHRVARSSHVGGKKKLTVCVFLCVCMCALRWPDAACKRTGALLCYFPSRCMLWGVSVCVAARGCDGGMCAPVWRDAHQVAFPSSFSKRPRHSHIGCHVLQGAKSQLTEWQLVASRPAGCPYLLGC